MAARYDLLIALAKAHQPRRILEIGVASGNTAKQLLCAAPEAEYFGVDLFEDLTSDVAKAEFNGKKVMSMDEVYSRLKPFGDGRVSLFKGNTREVLPDLCMEWSLAGIEFDLIFIDGGHSEETIRSDYDCVHAVIADNGMIVFDDYYSGTYPKGMGCNNTIDLLLSEGLEAEFSPVDRMGPMGIQMVSVTYH